MGGFREPSFGNLEARAAKDKSVAADLSGDVKSARLCPGCRVLLRRGISIKPTWPKLLQVATTCGPFLLIGNATTAAAFAERFPDAAIFNLRNHSFAIKRDYDSVRDFADIAEIEFLHINAQTSVAGWYPHGLTELSPVTRSDGDEWSGGAPPHCRSNS